MDNCFKQIYGFFYKQTLTKYFVNIKSPTTSHQQGIKNSYKNSKNKNHKEIIDKLIRTKKIINIYLLKKNKISKNLKYNFWWE